MTLQTAGTEAFCGSQPGAGGESHKSAALQVCHRARLLARMISRACTAARFSSGVSLMLLGQSW